MIYQICNQGHEQVATFYKVAVIKKESLSFFTHLTPQATIQDIVTNLNENADAFIANLLPEDLSLNQTTRTGDYGKQYRVRSGFLLTPLDEALQAYMEEYNNTEVVILLDKNGATHLYGTTNTPLLFTYNERHSNTGDGAKGYDINIQGDTLGAGKIMENITLDIFNAGLAFPLAGTL